MNDVRRQQQKAFADGINELTKHLGLGMGAAVTTMINICVATTRAYGEGDAMVALREVFEERMAATNYDLYQAGQVKQ
jgi:hypothetical protein